MQVAGGSNKGERRIDKVIDRARGREIERERKSDYSLTILFAACQTKQKLSRVR